MPLKSIVAGIEAVEVIPGRCEVVDEGQEFSVIVDAADTPEVCVRVCVCARARACVRVCVRCQHALGWGMLQH